MHPRAGLDLTRHTSDGLSAFPYSQLRPCARCVTELRESFRCEGSLTAVDHRRHFPTSDRSEVRRARHAKYAVALMFFLNANSSAWAPITTNPWSLYFSAQART